MIKSSMAIGSSRLYWGRGWHEWSTI